MSIYHAAWFSPTKEDLIKGEQILAIAKESTMDKKQRDYSNAIDSFYMGWNKANHTIRAVRSRKKKEQIYLKYAEDMEAIIFYTLAFFLLETA